MIPAVFALTVALLQQPSGQAPRAHADPFDSTKAQFKYVGLAVADVKSALDVYRRAVFNGTDDEVVHDGVSLGSSCEAADTTTRRALPRICRHCASPDAQAAFDAYRQMLPSLRAGLARCAARVGQLDRGNERAKRMRGAVREISNPLVMTLRNYESYVARVRKALHLVAPPPPARRAPGPTGR